MGKDSHFTGQPVYSQVLKLLDKDKIRQISHDTQGSEFDGRGNGWIFDVNLTASRQQDLSGEGTTSCAKADDDSPPSPL